MILPFLMGNQDYKYNFHLTVVNKSYLEKLLATVGFRESRAWQPGSDNLTSFDDFSAFKYQFNARLYAISLNLEAVK